MKLNTTSQYAIRVLSYMAKDNEVNFYQAKDISDTLDIPYKYLTRIMSQLVSADLIVSTRGRVGGYSLAKEPEDIKIVEILNAVKECINDENCILGIGACREDKKCALHDIWKAPKKSMVKMFTNTTLKDIS